MTPTSRGRVSKPDRHDLKGDFDQYARHIAVADRLRELAEKM